MLINLRGVKESGAIFAIPTYFFVVMMYITVVVGLARFAMGTLGVVPNPPTMETLHGAQALSLFLILRAFSSGTTALTGVEAISNGIPAFKQPRSRNAGTTLIWMSIILGSLMLGITFLATRIGAVPSESETLISQLARTAYGGRNILYLATIAATTLILIMAANTSFADFPRLSALLAARRVPAAATGLPRQPVGVLARHRGPGAGRVLADHHLQGQRDAVDPAVRHRRVPLLHPVAGRHGAPLVEDRPPGTGAGGQGGRLDAALRGGLAEQDGHQRLSARS